MEKTKHKKLRNHTIAIVSISFNFVHPNIHCTILCVIYNLFSVFWAVLKFVRIFMFMFYSIWCQFADCLNFDRWRQLRKCNIVKANCEGKTNKQQQAWARLTRPAITSDESCSKNINLWLISFAQRSIFFWKFVY